MDRVRSDSASGTAPALVEVVDYKWSRKFHDLVREAQWSEDTLHRHSGEQGYEYLFQLAFYVWLLAHGSEVMGPTLTARLVWLPAAGPARRLLAWVRAHADRWQLTPDMATRLARDVEALVEAVVRGLAAGQFEVRPGPPCRLCQFDQICRYRDEGLWIQDAGCKMQDEAG
jgi:hypothetical protein